MILAWPTPSALPVLGAAYPACGSSEDVTAHGIGLSINVADVGQSKCEFSSGPPERSRDSKGNQLMQNLRWERKPCLSCPRTVRRLLRARCFQIQFAPEGPADGRPPPRRFRDTFAVKLVRQWRLRRIDPLKDSLSTPQPTNKNYVLYDFRSFGSPRRLTCSVKTNHATS